MLGSLLAFAWVAAWLQVLASRTGTPGAWTAWIPVANLFLMARIGGEGGGAPGARAGPGGGLRGLGRHRQRHVITCQVSTQFGGTLDQARAEWRRVREGAFRVLDERYGGP